MTKELPQEYYNALKKVPEGQSAIPFLTPLDKDNFTEEKLGEDIFKVTMESSYIIVTVKQDDENISLKISDSHFETDYYEAKLMGYIMVKIVPQIKK